MSFRIFVEIDYQLDELKKSIGEAKGIKVAELFVNQLISPDPNLNHGIYVFKSQKGDVYVGKCTSRSFVERIAAHFDNRDNAWMNTILKKISKSENITIQESYNYFLSSFELILIPLNKNFINKNNVNSLEKELINCIATLNKKRKL
jgi:hypothetical protein